MAEAEQNMFDIPRSRVERSHQIANLVYRRFNSALRGFLMNNLRNKADVDDFAQEVYLRFSRLPEPHKIRCERAFLFTTAANLLRDRSRRLATRLENASIPIDELPLECNSADPANGAIYLDQVKAMWDALRFVSDDCRRVFLMSRVDGKSYVEIATTMSVSVSMIEKHIIAALKAIREGLDLN